MASNRRFQFMAVGDACQERKMAWYALEHTWRVCSAQVFGSGLVEAAGLSARV
jgi:hypothetical protein